MTDEEYAALVAKALGKNIDDFSLAPPNYAEGDVMPFAYNPNRFAGQDALRQEWEQPKTYITMEDILLLLLGRQGQDKRI